MRLLLTYLRGFFLRYCQTDLNEIAQSVFVGNIDLRSAVQIYQLNQKELRFVANSVSEYYSTEQYVRERSAPTA